MKHLRHEDEIVYFSILLWSVHSQRFYLSLETISVSLCQQHHLKHPSSIHPNPIRRPPQTADTHHPPLHHPTHPEHYSNVSREQITVRQSNDNMLYLTSYVFDHRRLLWLPGHLCKSRTQRSTAGFDWLFSPSGARLEGLLMSGELGWFPALVDGRSRPVICHVHFLWPSCLLDALVGLLVS